MMHRDLSIFELTSNDVNSCCGVNDTASCLSDSLVHDAEPVTISYDVKLCDPTCGRQFE